jgi:SulP family sulfate permease
MNRFDIRFHPRLLDEMKDYDTTKFFRDLTAGLTVGVVALPLAMAFAVASGLKPEAGIFTAIIAGFLFRSADRPGLLLSLCTASSKNTVWPIC